MVFVAVLEAESEFPLSAIVTITTVLTIGITMLLFRQRIKDVLSRMKKAILSLRKTDNPSEGGVVYSKEKQQQESRLIESTDSEVGQYEEKHLDSESTIEVPILIEKKK